MSCVAALLLGLFFSAPPAEDVNQAAKRVLSDSDYQSAFPGMDLQPAPHTGPARGRDDRDLFFPSAALAQVARVLLYVLIGVVFLLAAFWLVRRLSGPTADAVMAGAEVPDPSAAADPAAALGDAEALAAGGRFTEAIHVLLLRALELLSRKKTVAGSLTSREILRDVPLGDDAQEAVGRLVRAVEVSLFGGRDPGEDAYQTSLDAYRRFAAAYGRAGGAA